MDKKSLSILSFLIIPGLGMLYTLISPTIQNIQPIVWYTTITARVIIIIFCLVISLISTGLIIMKKYSTVDSLQDHRDKAKIDKITNFINDYISESHTSSDKESINEWVKNNYKK